MSFNNDKTVDLVHKVAKKYMIREGVFQLTTEQIAALLNHVEETTRAKALAEAETIYKGCVTLPRI